MRHLICDELAPSNHFIFSSSEYLHTFIFHLHSETGDSLKAISRKLKFKTGWDENHIKDDLKWKEKLLSDLLFV